MRLGLAEADDIKIDWRIYVLRLHYLLPAREMIEMGSPTGGCDERFEFDSWD